MIARGLAIVALLVTACQADLGQQSDDLDNVALRDHIIAFVRSVAEGGSNVACTVPLRGESLQVVVTMYADGEIVGRGTGIDDLLCVALKAATEQAVAAAGPARVARSRFVVELSDYEYALVEYEGRGLELVAGVVPVRTLERALLRRRIDEGKAYLLRVINPDLGGVHKYYYAPHDTFEERLYTVYTASTIYTLLAVYAHDHDERLRLPIERAADFLLWMQRIAPGQPGHGAFHYSLALAGFEREPRFVVGTTSKTIFTLIKLHELSQDDVYLDAARLAADWLLTMQDDDGRVRSELRQRTNGTWRVI
jgi:hypothetical protein